MALVTERYYSQTYYGEPVAEFGRLEARAEDAVLALISLSPDRVMLLPDDKQNAVYKAICAQIEYLNEYGIFVSTYGKVESGFTVGKVRVDDGGSAALTGAKSMLCPAVYAYLERTGLLNPAVPVGDFPWIVRWF